MRAYQRLLEYVKYGTASSETTGTTPSTPGQKVLGTALKIELESLGIPAECDENGYVYAQIPATEGCGDVPAVGFIAHMDTSPECSGDNVVPRITENYGGGDLDLGHGTVLRVSDIPHLAGLRGRTLITASGDTLLGADDKAGVAEIMTLAERLISENRPHGKICIAFTPDEEIGEGADHFDVKKFGADFAYTVDGDAAGGVEYENFNASAADVVIKGFSVHPGSSKDTMINAALVAMEFNSLLPATDIPRNTDGYEGFYHLCSITGDVSDSEMKYIIRDHNAEIFAYRNSVIKHIADILNAKYGEGTVTVTVKEQYRNMAEIILPEYHIIETAVRATEKAGVKPFISPIRGGTDGARLSFMGLPCPNLGTGGYAFHGPYEHTTAEGMDEVTEILLNIVSEVAGK